MRFFKVFLNLIFGIVLLSANFVSLNHHHEGGEKHIDCQICILQLNQQSEDPSDLTFEVDFSQEKSDYENKLTQKNHQKIISYRISIRGPPSFNL